MKTNTFSKLLVVVAVAGFIFTGCKKDDSGSAELTDNTVIQTTKDEESQDAMAEATEQNVDNVMDGIEANGFSGLKAAVTGDPSVTISSKDTSTFPKTITLVYNTDTTINGETFKQTGTITITVTLVGNKRPWRNFIKRSITFNQFKVENDSASFEINGTRTVTRKSTNAIITDNHLRLAIVDSIKSDFTLIVKSGALFTDTFTRVVNKKRSAIAHFGRLSPNYRFRQEFAKDTLQFEGSVTGVNFRNQNYSRVIVSPVIINRCPVVLAPVITSGKIEFTNGNKTGTLTYSNDACKTIVTIEVDGKVKQIERRMNRIFRRWW